MTDPNPISWQVGRFRITRVVERDIADAMMTVIPDATREAVRAIGWLVPHFATPEGKLLALVQSFVIDDGDCRVIVDTCVGNHKHRPRLPSWHMSDLPFLESLDAAGYPPDSIDIVFCTHLHGDHIGWNTTLRDGRWVPTFPKARYLFGAGELEFAQAIMARGEFEAASYRDSIAPILEAGQAETVAPDAEIAPGLTLVPTPGHTPGHASLLIESDGESAFITGDCIHHPGQMVRMDWTPKVDAEPEAARATRRQVLDRFADSPTLFIGTHFAGPTAGKLIKDGTAWRLLV